MTLHINEAEVRELLSMPLAIEAVEEVSRNQAAGETELHPRRRIDLRGVGFFHYMAAADFAAGYVATKQYTFVKGRARFVVLLFEIQTGAMAALIEADLLGRLRTGAASGVATKYLARENARVAAIIGTGGQARTQLEAVAAVRKLESVRAYGRKLERREQFCREMSTKLGIPVHAAASADEAVRGADIVCTATTAGHPVFNGAELAPGTHINAMGANFSHKRELDDAAIARVNRFVVDSVEQSAQEAGDLMIPFGRDEALWAQVVELNEVVAGKVRGRRADLDITLFKSVGIALWDLAVAVRVYTLARKQGRGRELALWEAERESCD